MSHHHVQSILTGKPSSKLLFQALIALLMAGVFFFLKPHSFLGWVALVFAGLYLLGGVFPQWAGIAKLSSYFARLISKLLTWLLLVPFYYLFFTAGRLILHLQGKDPLHRRWDKQLASYWVDSPSGLSRSYQRQY